MRIPKSKVRVVLLLLGLVTLAHAADEPAGQEKVDWVSLRIAVEVDGPKTTRLAFIAENTGKDDVVTDPICLNWNWVEVVYPDGRVRKLRWMGKTMPGAEVVIKPSETKIWRVDLARWMKFKALGIYKVRWKLVRATERATAESPEIFLLKSEEAE